MRGVRTEPIVREAEAVSVVKRETCPLGGTWVGAGERKFLLGPYFISSSWSETARVSQVERKTKTNKQSHEFWSA